MKKLFIEQEEPDFDDDLPSPYKNRFKNEEEMINYYELKAVDVGDNFEAEDDPFFYEASPPVVRKNSWEERLMKSNKRDTLNDSRHNDFIGFDEFE